MNIYDDQELIAFFHSISNDLTRIAVGIVGDNGDIDELISETVYRTYKNRRKIKNPEYLKTWMIRVLINLCNDYLKRKNRFVHLEENMVIEVKENYDFVYDYLDKIPTHLRELVVLKYIVGLSFQEIAVINEIPESTVKSRVYKALSLLKVEMEDINE